MKVAVSLLPVVKSMIAAWLPALAAAPENSSQPFVHWDRVGGHRVEADQLVHPVRGLQQHLVGYLRAHRVPDHREPVPAEFAGESDRVGRGLFHGERAGDLLAAAVTAQVHEGVGVGRAVEEVRQRAPAPGGAEPAVHGQHVAVTRPDAHERTRHADLRLSSSVA
jgi:hypothetical protein